MSWHDELADLHPCTDAWEWASRHDTIQAAWDACERGDWMLWYLERCGVDRPRLVLTACACARLGLPHVAAGATRPLRAIETAERWARGDADVTRAQVSAAASAAYAGGDAYDAAAATLRQCAAIVRAHFPIVEVPR